MLVVGELKDSRTDGTRETHGEIKNTHTVSGGNLKGRGTLGDLGLYDM